jgi:ubiquinol-cytochrome c reductase cytochrome b subunit
MLVAFRGYLLVNAQIRFWACMVITNLLSVIPFVGERLLLWIWGSFAVSQSTLKLFFLIHFLSPFVILLFILVHLYLLHVFISSSSLASLSLLLS